MMRSTTVPLLILNFALCSVHTRAGAADAAKEDDFDAKGVKIHYITKGDGEPVMMIHGFLSSAGINWILAGTFEALAKDHRVIALDMPGHGKSDKPLDPNAYGNQLVEDVILLMDHLSIPKAHIVGYSMGGMIAMKLVCTHPDRVLSCSLGGMGWFKEGSPIQKGWDRAPVKDPSQPLEICFHSLAKLYVNEEQVNAIKIPIECLVGDHDPCKFMYVEPLEKARPDIPVVVITDAGHLDCIVKQQYRDELVKWINKNKGK